MPPRKSALAKKATPASAKSHKRPLSETTPVATPVSRASKRIKETNEKERSAGRSTPSKSKYFEDPDSEDDHVLENEESGYEDEGSDLSVADEPSSDEVESEDDYGSKEETRARKRKPKKSSEATSGLGAVVNAVLEEGKELWRPGVKAGLGPGKQVFIEKPKPRSDGGIKYVPGKIHPNTMAFLKDLKANNDREWLKMHDPDYRQSWSDWQSFVEALTEKITELDETIPELPPKDLVWAGTSALHGGC